MQLHNLRKPFLTILAAFVLLTTSINFSFAANNSLPVITQKSITVSTFTTKEIIIKNTDGYKLKFSISNNKDKNNAYIKPAGKICFNYNKSNTSTLNIVGLRPTGYFNKPVITIYYTDSSGKKVNIGAVTVNVINNKTEPEFSMLKIGLNCSEDITFNYPYGSYAEGYTFKIDNEKIVKRTSSVYLEPKGKIYLETLTFKGLKKGSTNVKVYIGDIYVDNFTIKVVDKTSVLKKKNITLNFYKNGIIDKSMVYFTNREDSLIKYYNTKAKYYVKSSGSNIVSSNEGTCTAKNAGAATLTVYEKLNGKTTKVGTVKAKVLTGKMSEVAKYNSNSYDEGVFGRGEGYEYLSIKDKPTLDIQPIIQKRILNNKRNSQSSFALTDYKITYKSDDESIAKVDENGTVTAVGKGYTDIDFTITFSDGSVFISKCNVGIDN